MGNEHLIPENTTIETGDTGILAICECEEQRPADELLADAYTEESGDRDFVLVRRDGAVTNRYSDGVAGVIEEDKRAAENDDEPFCPECDTHARGWVHHHTAEDTALPDTAEEFIRHYVETNDIMVSTLSRNSLVSKPRLRLILDGERAQGDEAPSLLMYLFRAGHISHREFETAKAEYFA